MNDAQNHEELIKIARPWIKLLFWLFCAAVAVFTVGQLWPVIARILGVLSPFIIALIVAYVFHPIVSFVQHKLRLGRVAGIAALLAAMAAVFIGVLVWLVPVIYRQVVLASMALNKENLSEIFGRLTSSFHFDPATQELIKTQASTVFENLSALVRDKLGGVAVGGPMAKEGLAAVKNVAGGMLQGAAAATMFLVTIGMVAVIAFYYLLDMSAMPGIVRRMLPAGHRERVWAILVEADRNVGGFLRGQLIACVIVAALSTILLFFVGLREYAILIGCFAGMMHFIPYLGPVAGATPALLWALLSQNFSGWPERGLYALAILAGFAVIEVIDGLVTQPHIVGRGAGLHPLTVMLALAIGAQGGIGGMIIAVPAACLAKVLWVELYWKTRPEVGPPPGKEAKYPPSVLD